MKRLGWFVLRLVAGLLLAWVSVALVEQLRATNECVDDDRNHLKKR